MFGGCFDSLNRSQNILTSTNRLLNLWLGFFWIVSYPSTGVSNIQKPNVQNWNVLAWLTYFHSLDLRPPCILPSFQLRRWYSLSVQWMPSLYLLPNPTHCCRAFHILGPQNPQPPWTSWKKVRSVNTKLPTNAQHDSRAWPYRPIFAFSLWTHITWLTAMAQLPQPWSCLVSLTLPGSWVLPPILPHPKPWSPGLGLCFLSSSWTF